MCVCACGVCVCYSCLEREKGGGGVFVRACVCVWVFVCRYMFVCGVGWCRGCRVCVCVCAQIHTTEIKEEIPATVPEIKRLVAERYPLE